MKHYLKYSLIAMLAGNTAGMALVFIGMNYWLVLAVSSMFFLKIFKHVKDAACHDASVDEFGDRFISYNPDINSVQVWHKHAIRS